MQSFSLIYASHTKKGGHQWQSKLVCETYCFILLRVVDSVDVVALPVVAPEMMSSPSIYYTVAAALLVCRRRLRKQLEMHRSTRRHGAESMHSHRQTGATGMHGGPGWRPRCQTQPRRCGSGRLQLFFSSLLSALSIRLPEFSGSSSAAQALGRGEPAAGWYLRHATSGAFSSLRHLGGKATAHALLAHSIIVP
jgi:hypothetical protein